MKKRLIITISAALVLIALVLWSLYYLFPQKYSEQVTEYSNQYGIDKSLVYAIIKCESNFNANAMSSANAQGLMQLTPDTFSWAYSKQHNKQPESIMLFDAKTNICYGCATYSMLKAEFKDDTVALAAYNAGRSRVKSWLSNPQYSKDGKTLCDIPYPETKTYVKKVLNTQKIYKFLY